MKNQLEHSRNTVAGTSLKIRHWHPATDGPLSAEAVRKRLEELGYSCSFYIYAPGTIFPDHKHVTDKIDIVLKGRFMIHIDGENGILRDGDYIFIPKGTVHRAAVVGDEDVVSIDAERVL